jgi:hypothetical protein
MYRIYSHYETDSVWTTVSPWITQALLSSRYQFPSEVSPDLEFIRQSLSIGAMQLWCGWDKNESLDLVFITESIVYAGRRTLVIRWLSGGKIDEKLPDFGYLECWAKSHGFQAIHINGRKGWEKKMKSLGFIHEYTTLSRVIDQGVH